MCFMQAVDHGVAEALKLGVVAGIKALLFDKFPETLNEVEIGPIRGPEEEFHLKLGGKLPDQLRGLITGVIQDQRHRHLEIETGNLAEEIADTLAVDVSVMDDGNQFMTDRVKCSEHLEPLSAGRGGL